MDTIFGQNPTHTANSQNTKQMFQKQGQCPSVVKRSSYPNGKSRLNHLCPHPSPLKEHPKNKTQRGRLPTEVLSCHSLHSKLSRMLHPPPPSPSSREEALEQIWTLEDPRGASGSCSTLFISMWHPSPVHSACVAQPVCHVLSLRCLPWFLWDKVPQTRQLKKQNFVLASSGGPNPRQRCQQGPSR